MLLPDHTVFYSVSYTHLDVYKRQLLDVCDTKIFTFVREQIEIKTDFYSDQILLLNIRLARTNIRVKHHE